jgi:hypothetical protein
MNTSRAAGADQGAPGTPPAADRADLSGLESSAGMGSPLSDSNRRPLPYHRTSRVHPGPAEPEESDLTGPERTPQDPTTTSRRPQDAPRSVAGRFELGELVAYGVVGRGPYCDDVQCGGIHYHCSSCGAVTSMCGHVDPTDCERAKATGRDHPEFVEAIR